MATHSSILVWRNPWTEEAGRLQSMGLQRVGHDWVTNTHTHTHTHTHTLSRHTLPFSGKWGKSYPTEFWNKVSYKNMGRPPSLLLFRKGSSELVIRRHRLREKEYIFFTCQEARSHRTSTSRERWDKKITVKYRLFTSCFWNAGFVRKNQRQQRTQSITTCSWCGCAGRNVHVVGSQKWSTGKKVVLFLKGRQGRKVAFVELPLALEVLTNSKVRIWT